MTCPNCGEHMEGDGFSTPIICPNQLDVDESLEPDCNPVYCDFEG